MDFRHQPVVFDCAGAQLLGIVELPEIRGSDLGVLIVTGGPQYRIGSHRQFVAIARALAGAGIATMRFDYRGMGDSSGPVTAFDQISADIRAAVDTFVRVSEVGSVVLWGLCDAASACMIYAPSDRRICSLVAVNPWIRSDQGLARTYVKHYYRRRFTSRAFWRKLLVGDLPIARAATELAANLGKSLLPRNTDLEEVGRTVSRELDFRERMRDGLERFQGSVLLIICGKDLTAAEFCDFVKEAGDWRAVLDRRSVVFRQLPDADHTFSRAVWREEVIHFTNKWVYGEACGRSAERRLSTASIHGQ